MKRNLSVPIPMKYRVIIMLSVFLTAVLVPEPGYAAGVPPEDDGSLIEKLISLPVEGIYRAIQALGFKNYDELIFDTSKGDLSPFTEEEWDVVMTWYAAIRNAVWVMLVISVAVTGFRFMKSEGSPQKRSEAMRTAMSNIYAFAVVLFMPYFARIIFQLNGYMVSSFYSIAEGMGAVGGDGFDINGIRTGSIIATAFVRLGYAGLILFFNFLYVIRKFVITSMIIVTPIAAWSWSISGKYHGIGVVVGEVTSNVFMQAAHALVLALYLSLLAGGISGDFSPWWAQIFGMVALIPTANVIRNLLQGWLQFMGVNEEKWAGLATLGLSGIAGLVSIGKTMVPAKTAGAAAFNGFSSMSGGPGGNAGSVREGNVSYGGGASGSTGMAYIASGVRSIGDRASTLGGTAGKVIGGAMGLALGSEGAKQMAEVGQAVGSVVAGGGARAIAAGSGLAREVIKKRPGEEGGSMMQRLQEVTGANSGGEALGSALGMVAGAAFGERGIEAGVKAGKNAIPVATRATSILAGTNLDGFRWN
jgi:hypothetical protein